MLQQEQFMKIHDTADVKFLPGKMDTSNNLYVFSICNHAICI